jgi:hypothetical protein
MLGSTLAAAIADTKTLPFDMARVRLQIQKRSLQGAQGGTLQYSGMFDCVRKARSQSATPRPHAQESLAAPPACATPG